MKLCILDNDILEGQLGETYSSFGAMFIRRGAKTYLSPHWIPSSVPTARRSR